jgi:hypothetical protein
MKTLVNRLVLLFASAIPLLGHSAHAQMEGYYPKGGPDVNAEEVSLIQLIANLQTYDGKRVRVTAFLHLEFEGNVIYLHSEDFRYSLTKNALWINIPKDMTRDQMKLVNDQYVICTARFDAKMQGHMDLNSGELTDVTRLEVWSPRPREIQK